MQHLQIDPFGEIRYTESGISILVHLQENPADLTLTLIMQILVRLFYYPLTLPGGGQSTTLCLQSVRYL